MMERRLAAKLAADIIDYAREAGADEAGTLARLSAVHLAKRIAPQSGWDG